MSGYGSNTTIDEVATRIRGARRILFTTHVKPDGDGMGSALALARALEATGSDQRGEIFIMGPLEKRLAVIAADTPYRLVENGVPGDDYDLAVVMDTGAWSQVGPLESWLRRHHENVVGIDHHVRGDDDLAAMRLVDPTAASTTFMLAPLIECLGWPITAGEGGVAEALFVGLATDTGWFRYSNADAEALRLGARLLEMGVDKSRLHQLIEETFRPQRLALLARALASLEHRCDGQVAIMCLSPRDLDETDGRVEDLAELVNTPMVVNQIRVSALLVETAPGRTKMSLRSKPAASGSEEEALLDVNALAQRLGGGGHKHAAGASLKMGVEKARAALIAALDDNAGATVAGAPARDHPRRAG
ncbi:MAG: DHH family phosphoesterase [Planctomycetota bacterium]|jgi:phosphoesterase RecJ-like protein